MFLSISVFKDRIVFDLDVFFCHPLSLEVIAFPFLCSKKIFSGSFPGRGTKIMDLTEFFM